MDFDEPFLDVLPELMNTLTLKTEVGLIVTWNKRKQNYEYEWIKGSESTVDFTPEMRENALICVHTHPAYLYPDAKYNPPTAMDIRERLIDIIYYGKDAPNDYILDKNGVWKVNDLTPSAKEELDKIKANDDDISRFLDIAMHNANNNAYNLVKNSKNESSLSQYLKSMSGLWENEEHDMGISIQYVPYSIFRKRSDGTLNKTRG